MICSKWPASLARSSSPNLPTSLQPPIDSCSTSTSLSVFSPWSSSPFSI
jgi:hypothetical protein